jgi:hypothetical protein
VTCRRAFDVDLAAYLAEPEGTQWAEFRAHYLTCPDCSAEVGVWTGMEASMRSSLASEAAEHLASDLLARFEEDPRGLPADQWQRVDQHLQACRPCTDRLAALREFDFAALEAAAPPSPRQALRDAAGSLGQFVRGLLPARSSTARETLEELLPLGRPELVTQSRPDEATDPGLATGRRPASARSPLGVLVAIDGDHAGQVYRIFGGENRIGRSAECEVRIPSDALARVEAHLTAEAGHFELAAVSERGRILVNGEPMRSGELRDGDFVELGGQRLQLRSVGG